MSYFAYIFAPSRRWMPRKTWTPPVRWRAFRNVETLANAVRNHTGAWFLQWHPSGPGRRAWTMTMTNPKQWIDSLIVRYHFWCQSRLTGRVQTMFCESSVCDSNQVLPTRSYLPIESKAVSSPLRTLIQKLCLDAKIKFHVQCFQDLTFSRYCAFGNSFDKGNCNPRHYLEALGFEV